MRAERRCRRSGREAATSGDDGPEYTPGGENRGATAARHGAHAEERLPPVRGDRRNRRALRPRAGAEYRRAAAPAPAHGAALRVDIGRAACGVAAPRKYALGAGRAAGRPGARPRWSPPRSARRRGLDGEPDSRPRRNRRPCGGRRRPIPAAGPRYLAAARAQPLVPAARHPGGAARAPPGGWPRHLRALRQRGLQPRTGTRRDRRGAARHGGRVRGDLPVRRLLRALLPRVPDSARQRPAARRHLGSAHGGDRPVSAGAGPANLL